MNMNLKMKHVKSHLFNKALQNTMCNVMREGYITFSLLTSPRPDEEGWYTNMDKSNTYFL